MLRLSTTNKPQLVELLIRPICLWLSVHQYSRLGRTACRPLFNGPLARPFVLALPLIFSVPRPLGGEGGSQPALSSAGARRVRGSTSDRFNQTPPAATKPRPKPFAQKSPVRSERCRSKSARLCTPSFLDVCPGARPFGLGSAVHERCRPTPQSSAVVRSRNRQRTDPTGAAGGI